MWIRSEGYKSYLVFGSVCKKEIKTVDWVLVDVWRNGIQVDRKYPQNTQKRGPKIVFSGTPGRGVLRFWGGGIQESRS